MNRIMVEFLFPTTQSELNQGGGASYVIEKMERETGFEPRSLALRQRRIALPRGPAP